MPPKMTLGVMALYRGPQRNLEERAYFQQLTQRGAQLGIAVAVFTPQDVNRAKKQVLAHCYNLKTKRWYRSWLPLPFTIFDRCRYQPNARFRQLQRFRATFPHLNYLNRPLANKWGTHQALSDNVNIRPHLPATRLYESDAALWPFLSKYASVFLKPINGTGGRGIIRLRHTGRRYVLQGRDEQRHIIRKQFDNKQQLKSFLKRWTKNKRLIIQQGIDLFLNDGRVHDFRLLMQKNGKGAWEMTGCAGRIGAKRSITSNLHGGGKAIAMHELLKKRFSADEKAGSIQRQMERLSMLVVNEVEQKLGKICELALDIAVDRSGHPWLLEINPKPSRQVFAKIGEKETYETALRRPLEYALWLHDKATSSAT